MPKACRFLAGASLIFFLVAQVLPYALDFPPPDLSGLDSEHHARFIEAEQFNAPIRWCSISRDLVVFPLVFLLLAGGWAERWELKHDRGLRRWPAILGFLLALFLVFFAATLPGRFMQFRHWQVFGLSHLDGPAWMLLVLKSQVIPLFKFMAANLLIFCFMGLLPRRWWMAAAGMLFLLFHLLPELTGLTRPLDPVEETVPMEAGPYREALESVAAKAQRPCSFMVLDESRRSEIMNAYVMGKLGREYVVFSDTWLAKVPVEESAAALAHELGHLQTRHITTPLNKTLGLLGSFLILGLVARLHPVIPGQRLRAILFMVIISQMVSMLSRPALAALNRYQEREADAYALQLTQDPVALERVLVRTAKANLEGWQTPRWLYAYAASYPDLAMRVAACRSWKPR